MGADLTGYIVVGPKIVNDEDIKKAALKLLEIKTKNAGVDCPQCGEFFNKEDCDEECAQCGTALSINPFTCSDFLAAVTGLVENWPPDSRDCCTRQYNGKWIVFAGDMSWGDEPGGAGYEILKAISNSLIYEELGFE